MSRLKRWLGGVHSDLAGTPGFDASPKAARRRANLVMTLALNPAGWISRRSESLTFVDDHTLRRRTTLDFRLPKALVPRDLRDGEWVYVPLMVLRKGSLVHFDLADATGQSLTNLATAENAEVVGEGLVQLVDKAASIRGVAGLPDKAAWAARFADLTSARPGTEATDHREALLQNAEIMRILPPDAPERAPIEALIDMLATDFLLLVPIRFQPDEPVLVKVAFDEQDHWWTGTQGPGRKVGTMINAVLATLGLVAKRAVFRGLRAGEASSYHVEFEAPEDVFLASSRFIAERGGDVVLEDSERSARVHFHTAATHRGATATIRARLHARRNGARGAITITSVITAAMLLEGAHRAPSLDEQTSAALLLLVPTVLLAFLTRPGEHVYATRMLLGVRLLGGIAVLCSLAFALMLATGRFQTVPGTSPPLLVDPGSGEVANILAFIAIVIAVVLLIGLLTPRFRARWHVRALIGVLAYGLVCPPTLA